jgi:hypothetical protein
VEDGPTFTAEGRSIDWNAAAGHAAWQLGLRIERFEEARPLREGGPRRASARRAASRSGGVGGLSGLGA